LLLELVVMGFKSISLGICVWSFEKLSVFYS